MFAGMNKKWVCLLGLLAIAVVILWWVFLGSQRSRLFKAAESGDVVAMQRLLDSGADVNAQLNDNPVISWSLLHHAAYFGHTELIELLIARGAEINSRNHAILASPLHEAVRGGHVGAVKVLLAHGADVNAGNRQGATPLHEAANWERTEIAAILIAAGADVNDESSLGTPLDWASRGSDMAELLIRHGAHLRNTKPHRPAGYP